MSEEATINPDGTTTFTTTDETAGGSATTDENDFMGGDAGGGENLGGEGAEEILMDAARKGIDPALYLAGGFIVIVLIYFILHKRRMKKEQERDSFFSDMDGDKFNIKLPPAVDEYYELREKLEDDGWEPGKPPTSAQEAIPHRALAQALMKRCMADIPIVTFIQKESAGMNKLYSQSMCSVRQWQSYQAAESIIQQEIDEVRQESDDIQPGWSQSIWREAMQYHQMLKQKHELEAKKLEEMARKKKEEEEEAKKPKLTPEEIEQQKVEAAEKAAEELLKMEEREQASKKAFSNGGMKKGFLSSSTQKKK